MSSSDNSHVVPEFPAWDVFAERELHPDGEILSPASEMAALLQRVFSEREAFRQQADAAQDVPLQALAWQAVLVVQLAQALDFYQAELESHSLQRVYRHLRVVKDQMLDSLAKAGLEIVVPLGLPFEEVAERVHVAGWRHHADFDAERVAEVVEPIVLHGGRLLRPGRVVMGAPLAEAQAEAAAPQVAPAPDVGARTTDE